MSGRGGRDKFHTDYGPRSEEKSHRGRSNVRPSRHIWVGNLAHTITENTLANQFLRFGELQNVAFQPGRSYAFINFEKEEDAFAAVRALQGFVVAGNPLKIEFAKADKSSTPSHDGDYLPRRDEQRYSVRGSPFAPRDSRKRHYSPDPFYPDKSKMGGRNTDSPSEVLWIGFPASLKVDEVILRKTFSPFGEIEKVTVFPGRSYAFVRYKNVVAACRAKETLQGKLFGNPRVHICFAKSESSTSNSGRNSMNAPPSPHIKSYRQMGSSEDLRQDRNFGSFSGDRASRSPLFNTNMEHGDLDVMRFSRKDNVWTEVGGAFEQSRFQEPGILGGQENMYECHHSPTRDRVAHFRDFSPQQFPQKGVFYDDSWDLPEDPLLFHGAKKLKMGSFPPENELPEYPFSSPNQAKRAIPRLFPESPQHEGPHKTFESGPFPCKQVLERSMTLTQPYEERSDHCNAPNLSFRAGSGSLPPNPVERKRLPPELHQPSLTEEWKWEGTIAKGGTPVCRARCFPNGKVLDMMLPEFLDCTARTSLDMLAKHYYQAASVWVVFFVPETDADIGFYNEFMHYLGDKQRAAVAKLDERTTLFLVPPSEFSEKVLKIPGDLSISGVVLRLEQPGSKFGSSIQRPQDNKDGDFMTCHGDMSHPQPTSPSGPLHSLTSYPGIGHAMGSTFDPAEENRHYVSYQQNPTFKSNWSPHHLQYSNSAAGKIVPQASNTSVESAIQGYNPLMPRAVQETSSNSYTTGISGFPVSGNRNLSHQETRPFVSASMSAAALQSEQFEQLASSLLGQPRRSMGGPIPPLSIGQSRTMNHPENSYWTSQNYGLASSHFGEVQPGQPQKASNVPATSQRGFQTQLVYSELPASQIGQVQPGQLQQASNVPAASQKEFHTVAQGNHQPAQANQPLQSSGTQEEDADPQKRLQATLQLAAALLQQIQQGKGT